MSDSRSMRIKYADDGEKLLNWISKNYRVLENSRIIDFVDLVCFSCEQNIPVRIDYFKYFSLATTGCGECNWEIQYKIEREKD